MKSIAIAAEANIYERDERLRHVQRPVILSLKIMLTDGTIAHDLRQEVPAGNHDMEQIIIRQWEALIRNVSTYYEDFASAQILRI